MNLETELENIKALGVEAFNNSKGVQFKPEDLDMLVNRPEGNKLATFFFVTKAPGDHVRFQLELEAFGLNVQTKPFILKVKRNSSEGTLNSEIFTASLVLHKDNFKHVKSYLETKTFKDFSSKSLNFKTASGLALKTKSGLGLNLNR